MKLSPLQTFDGENCEGVDALDSHIQRAERPPHNPMAKLDGSCLEAVHKYFAKGLTQSTHKTYNSGKERYVKFCAEPSLTPVPVSEPVVSSFVAFLALEGLSISSPRRLEASHNYSVLVSG